jgi:hypothetical protein
MPLIDLILKLDKEGSAVEQEIYRFVLEHPDSVNERNAFGGTPLSVAMSVEESSDEMPVAEFLLDHGADPNAHLYDSEMTPLNDALHAMEDAMDDVGLPRVKVLKLLLDHGADPLAVDDYGQNAYENAWFSIAHFLMEDFRRAGKAGIADWSDVDLNPPLWGPKERGRFGLTCLFGNEDAPDVLEGWLAGLARGCAFSGHAPLDLSFRWNWRPGTDQFRMFSPGSLLVWARARLVGPRDSGDLWWPVMYWEFLDRLKAHLERYGFPAHEGWVDAARRDGAYRAIDDLEAVFRQFAEHGAPDPLPMEPRSGDWKWRRSGD